MADSKRTLNDLLKNTRGFRLKEAAATHSSEYKHSRPGDHHLVDMTFVGEDGEEVQVQLIIVDHQARERAWKSIDIAIPAPKKSEKAE